MTISEALSWWDKGLRAREVKECHTFPYKSLHTFDMQRSFQIFIADILDVSQIYVNKILNKSTSGKFSSSRAGYHSKLWEQKRVGGVRYTLLWEKLLQSGLPSKALSPPDEHSHEFVIARCHKLCCFSMLFNILSVFMEEYKCVPHIQSLRTFTCSA